MTGSIPGALTIEIIAAGLVTLAVSAVSGLGWLYRRLTRLETQMAERTAAVASQKDVHQVELALERLNGRLDQHEEVDRSLGRSLDDVRDRVKDLQSAVQRVDDYLRKSGQ